MAGAPDGPAVGREMRTVSRLTPGGGGTPGCGGREMRTVSFLGRLLGGVGVGSSGMGMVAVGVGVIRPGNGPRRESAAGPFRAVNPWQGGVVQKTIGMLDESAGARKADICGGWEDSDCEGAGAWQVGGQSARAPDCGTRPRRHHPPSTADRRVF